MNSAVVALAHEPKAEKGKSRDHARGRSDSHQQGNLEKSHDHCPYRDSSFERKDFCQQIRRQVHHRVEGFEIGLCLEPKKSNVDAEIPIMKTRSFSGCMPLAACP